MNPLVNIHDDPSGADVTLKVRDQEISTFSQILCADSEKFRELVQEKKGDIVIPDFIDVNMMTKMINYMSGGSLEIRDEEELCKMTQASDYFKLQKLKNTCIQSLNARLTYRNVLTLYYLSRKIQPCKDLFNKCENFLCAHFDEVIEEEEFIMLPPEEVRQIVSLCKRLGIHDDSLLRAALNWLQKDPPSRTQSMKDLFQHIALAQCTPYVLNKAILRCHDILETDHMIYIALTDAYSHNARHHTSLCFVGGRKRQDANRDCFVLSKNNELLSFAEIPQAFSEWSSFCNIPGDGFVVTGGRDSMKCHSYNAQLESWAELQPLNAIRFGHGSVFLQGSLYIIGGHKQDDRYHDTIEIYKKGEWQVGITKLPLQMHCPQAVTVNERIFVYAANRFYEMIPKDNCKWNPLPLPEGYKDDDLHGSTIASAKNKVYIAGGEKNILATFTPEITQWQILQSPMYKHIDGALTFFDNSLFLVGGDDQQEVEEFEFHSKTWKKGRFTVSFNLWKHYAFVMDIPDNQ